MSIPNHQSFKLRLQKQSYFESLISQKPKGNLSDAESTTTGTATTIAYLSVRHNKLAARHLKSKPEFSNDHSSKPSQSSFGGKLESDLPSSCQNVNRPSIKNHLMISGSSDVSSSGTAGHDKPISSSDTSNHKIPLDQPVKISKIQPAKGKVNLSNFSNPISQSPVTINKQSINYIRNGIKLKHGITPSPKTFMAPQSSFYNHFNANSFDDSRSKGSGWN